MRRESNDPTRKYNTTGNVPGQVRGGSTLGRFSFGNEPGTKKNGQHYSLAVSNYDAKFEISATLGLRGNGCGAPAIEATILATSIEISEIMVVSVV